MMDAGLEIMEFSGMLIAQGDGTGRDGYVGEGYVGKEGMEVV